MKKGSYKLTEYPFSNKICVVTGPVPAPKSSPIEFLKSKSFWILSVIGETKCLYPSSCISFWWSKYLFFLSSRQISLGISYISITGFAVIKDMLLICIKNLNTGGFTKRAVHKKTPKKGAWFYSKCSFNFLYLACNNSNSSLSFWMLLCTSLTIGLFSSTCWKKPRLFSCWLIDCLTSSIFLVIK